MKNKLLIAISFLAIALFSATFASAQAEPQEGPSSGTQEGSSNSVGRISLIHGDVSTQRGDSGEWSAAALNAPVVSGDKVSTGDNSRAEIQLDDANILRLGDRSQATLANIARNQIQVQLGQGIANYSVFKGGEANVEIDTPNVSVHPASGSGSYRIEVNANGETEVIVRNGEADISTPQGSTHLERGQLASIRGTGDDTQYKIADAPERDSWDTWNSERDHMIQNADSWRHTNRYYVGSEDLDAYGHWENVPDYGPVWAPVVAPGWVPYRAGRWVWEPYWGWTWVSYEPWGWAPYHYGRWMFYGSSWVWWPGPVYGGGFYRPVWAPAYVSFFGFGGGVGFGVGFGFGSIGWLPVGPCDHFYPWYGHYGNHFNVVNITNVTRVNVTNIRTVNNFGGVAPLRTGNQYSNLRLAATNANFRSAISTVPSNHFGSGRVPATAVTQQMFNSGRMMTGNLPVVPSRQNLSASNRAAAPSTVRTGTQSFFSNSRPVAARPSFDRQTASLQAAIQHNGFTPIRSAESGSMTKPGSLTAGNNSVAKPSPGTPAQNSTMNRGNSSIAKGPANPAGNAGNNGYRTFGSVAQNRGPQNQVNNNSTVPRPPQAQIARPQVSPSTGSDQGWRRFSDSNTGANRNVAQPMNNRSFGSTGSPNLGAQGHVNNVPRPPQSSTVGPANNNGGWRTFSAPANQGQVGNRGGQVNQQFNRYPSRNSAPTMTSPRGGSYYGGGMSSSRPPLDMRKNIVTPRSYGPTSYQGGSGSYQGGSGSYHGGGGSYHGGAGSAPHSSSGSSSSHASSGHGGHR